MELKLENAVEQAGQKPGACGVDLGKCNVFKRLNQGVTDEAQIQIPCYKLCTFPPPTGLPEKMMEYNRGPVYATVATIIFGNTPR